MSENTTAPSNAEKDINATKKEDAVKAATEALATELNGVVKRREHWESTDFKKANDVLYGILSDCYGIYHRRFVGAENDDQRTDLRKHLRSCLDSAKIRVTKQSTTLTMLIRWVFRSDRQRASRYAYVLTAAASHGIKPEGLAAWITAGGGIEEIKRKVVKRAETIARQSALETKQAMVMSEIEQAETHPMAEVEIKGLKGDLVLMIGRPTGDGNKAAVVGVLPEASQRMFEDIVRRIAKSRLDNEQAAALNAKEMAKVSSEDKTANDSVLKKQA